MGYRTFSFIIAAFFFFTHTISAQEREYIVTNNNDTIYGEISRGLNILNPTPVKYLLKDEQGNKIALDPAEVRFIKSINGVDGDCLMASVYDMGFAKRIIDGKIKVYLSVDAAVFYTSKNDSDIRYTEFGGFSSRKKAHAEIRPLLEDNPMIVKEFDNLQGSEQNILYIIEKYNNLYRS